MHQDVSLEKPQNLSDPLLILLQNAITSTEVEAGGSSGEGWKGKMLHGNARDSLLKLNWSLLMECNLIFAVTCPVPTRLAV